MDMKKMFGMEEEEIKAGISDEQKLSALDTLLKELGYGETTMKDETKPCLKCGKSSDECECEEEMEEPYEAKGAKDPKGVGLTVIIGKSKKA